MFRLPIVESRLESRAPVIPQRTARSFPRSQAPHGRLVCFQTGRPTCDTASTIAERDNPMSEKLLNCVLLADGHSELTEAVRGLLETAFKAVLTVTNEASLLEGAKPASTRRDGRGSVSGPQQGPGLVASGPGALPRGQGDRHQRPRRAERAAGGDGGRGRCLRAQMRDRDRPAAGRRVRLSSFSGRGAIEAGRHPRRRNHVLPVRLARRARSSGRQCLW